MSARRVKVTELAKANQVTGRTVYRDIEDLLSIGGIPINVNEQGQYYLMGAIDFVNKDPKSNIIMEKILSAFFYGVNPETIKEILDGEPEVPRTPFHLLMQTSPLNPVILETVISALAQKKWLRLMYRKNSCPENEASNWESPEAQERTVKPFELFFQRHAWYLLAWSRKRSDYRFFRLNRIESAEIITTEPDEQLPPFSREALEDSLGLYISKKPEPVLLKFQPATAPFIEEVQWHPSQSFTRLDDGCLEMSLNVADDHFLRSWILSFGAGVQVLKPDTLAEYVRQQLQEALEKYT
jgi:predicted DNA-binding transcriptional regulator YafY